MRHGYGWALSVPLAVVAVALAVIGLGHLIHPSWVGEQPDSAGYVQKAFGLLTDAAHATAELFYSAVENVIVFVAAIFLGKRAIRREHARLDAEHGFPEHD